MGRTSGKLSMALFACLIQLFLAGRGASEVVDRIVAEVNDEVITMSELKTMAKGFEAKQGINPSKTEGREIQRHLLDALIDRKLARAEAKKRGMTLTDKEIAQALDNFKKRNNLPDDETLKQALSQTGLTLNELKQQLTDQIIQNRLMMVAAGSKVEVREEDVRKAYEGMPKEGGVQLHLLAIKVPFPPDATDVQKGAMRQKAEAVIQEAQQGTPFSEIATKLSVSGADLGYVPLSDIDPKMAEHLIRLKPKELLPVEAPQGFQIFQVLDRRTGKARSFEEAAPEIRNLLMEKEMEKYFEGWIKGMRAKAHIKIML